MSRLEGLPFVFLPFCKHFIYFIVVRVSCLYCGFMYQTLLLYQYAWAKYIMNMVADVNRQCL